MIRFGSGEKNFLHPATLKQLGESQVPPWLKDTQDIPHGFALIFKRTRSGLDGCHDVHKDHLSIDFAEVISKKRLNHLPFVRFKTAFKFFIERFLVYFVT